MFKNSAKIFIIGCDFKKYIIVSKKINDVIVNEIIFFKNLFLILFSPINIAIKPKQVDMYAINEFIISFF